MPRIPLRKPLPLKRRTWIPPAYPKVPSGVPAFASKPHTTYKLRNKILAGGKNILFGNNVSEFKNRTRRIWRPNIKVKSLWSDALGRRVRLRMVTSVLRTIDKSGGLDAYLTGVTKARMKELGPRGWEIRAAVIKSIRQQERVKYIKMFQRSILLCPQLRMNSSWREIRPLIRHTEGYAVLPEEYCKKAFRDIMERLREGRPVMRQRVIRRRPRVIILTNTKAAKLSRKARLRDENREKKLRDTRYRKLALVHAKLKTKTAALKNIEETPLVSPQPKPVDEAKVRERRKQRKAEKHKKHVEYQRRVRAEAKQASIKKKQLRKARLS